MKSPWKEILIALIIGLAVGYFAGTRFSGDHPRHWKKGQMLERFGKELSLDPGQKEKIGKILETKRAQFKSLRDEMQPKFEEIRNSSKAEIEKLLTPEQAQKFEKLEERWEAHRKQKLAEVR